MAGWVNSAGAGAGSGIGNGRGAGGRGFTNRRYTGDAVHGGSSSGGSRWRGERSRGRPPSQPHYRYRPVDAAQRQPPSTGPALSDQAASSASTRHAQITHPASATDKSSASGTVAPASSNKEPDDKANRNAANFECNVCFELAAEPVVTKCGHLFCWECLYQWLHVHSHHRECPVCKGQVADDAIIPIYGRGGSAASVDNAPPRPTGSRVESSRQQQQQHHHHLYTPQQMVYVDDDEEDDPFDFPSMMNFGFGATSVRDAVRSFMSPSFDDVEMEDHFDDYTYDYSPDDFDEVHDYNLLGFPMFPPPVTGAEVANPSSSHSHPQFEYVDIDSIIPSHHREFGYPIAAPPSHNRGRHGRRGHRARASADQSSTDAMVTGGSGAFCRDNSANSNVSAGASSRPNGGWAERRGRSNRNSNSAGGRGMQDGRRHRTSYS